MSESEGFQIQLNNQSWREYQMHARISAKYLLRGSRSMSFAERLIAVKSKIFAIMICLLIVVLIISLSWNYFLPKIISKSVYVHNGLFTFVRPINLADENAIFLQSISIMAGVVIAFIVKSIAFQIFLRKRWMDDAKLGWHRVTISHDGVQIEAPNAAIRRAWHSIDNVWSQSSSIIFASGSSVFFSLSTLGLERNRQLEILAFASAKILGSRGSRTV